MKKFLTNIQHEAQTYRLSAGEKAKMHKALLAHMGKGVPTPYATQSPYVFMSFFSGQVRYAMAGVMLFVLAGAGTTSAAAHALPGDLLYPIKVSVNEKFEAALAPTAAAKAEAEVRFAERRIEEAQVLAAQGRLDAAVAEKLAVSFDAHAHNAQQFADAAAAEEPATAAQVQTKLASSVSVNSAVLKMLGKNSNSSTREHSDALATRVVARAEGSARVAAQTRSFAASVPPEVSLKGAGGAEGAVEPMAMMMVAEDAATMVVAEDPGSQKVATTLQKKAAELLAEAKKRYTAVKATLDATTTAQIDAEFAVVDTHMGLGATALGAGEFAAAEADFTEALRMAGRLQALLKAEQKFDNGILKNLIRGEVQGAFIEVDVPLPAPAELDIRI